jgi:hypothetical protein
MKNLEMLLTLQKLNKSIFLNKMTKQFGREILRPILMLLMDL